MNHGLRDQDIQTIIHVLHEYPQVEKAKIYGSRAMGNYKPGSDIDLALFGDISISTLSQIQYSLEEESALPYHFDLTVYNHTDNQNLKKHIDQEGLTIYPAVVA
jgi:uncharacterized protein